MNFYGNFSFSSPLGSTLDDSPVNLPPIGVALGLFHIICVETINLKKPISDAESQLPKDEDENLTSDGNLGTTLACASEYVTPLSKLPYEEQLAQKQETSAKIFRTLCNKLRRLGINIPNINKQIDLLLPVFVLFINCSLNLDNLLFSSLIQFDTLQNLKT